MSGWESKQSAEYRLDLGCGHVLLVHGPTVSRAHLTLIPTFWRTDGDMVTTEERLEVLVAPVEFMQREALEQARTVLREALGKVEMALLESEERGDEVSGLKQKAPSEAKR